MENANWGEQWKPIVFKEGETIRKYHISNFGRVRSIGKSGAEPKILVGGIIGGYKVLSVKLATGMSSTKYVHKLVAEAYCPKMSEDEKFVLHMDYNKNNNHYLNLRWANREQKLAHSRANPSPKNKKRRGEGLTEAKLKMIRRLLTINPGRLKLIAKQFKVTMPQIEKIKNGATLSEVLAG